MSEKELKTSTAVGEDWDWKQVQSVWERISSLHDHFKKTGIELPWTARGTLFSTMQLFLLESGGDLAAARAALVDLVQLCSSFVAEQVLANMQVAWKDQELEGQQLNPLERARLKENIETLEISIEGAVVPLLTPEELEITLEAQDKISNVLREVSDEAGPEATVRALVASVQQVQLFACQGDVLGAKATVLDLLHQMWPVALHNAQQLAEVASDQLKDGPPATRPN